MWVFGKISQIKFEKNNIKFIPFKKKLVLKWVRVPKEKLISIKIWYNKKKVQNLLTVC